jgi:thymidylate synthase (FAD)
VATFQIKAPIAVARQCFKSKVGFSDTDPDLEPMFAENEESRRYIDDPPTFYAEVVWRARPTGGAKQGSGSPVDAATAAEADAILRDIQARSDAAYAALLALNVAPEQARFGLVQSAETEWRWTGSLAAWARFCHLRLAPDVQGETREVAARVAEKMADLFPISWAALAGWRPSEEVAA